MQTYAAFQNQTHLFMLTELVNGGDLCEYMLAQDGGLKNDFLKFQNQMYNLIYFLYLCIFLQQKT